MIKDEEVAAYRRDGVLVVEDVLDAAQLAEARRVVDEFIAGSREVTAHNDVYDLEPGHTPEAPRVRRIKTPHKHHPLFWDIARLPRLVAILQRLLGPGVRLHGSKINLKSPQFGSPVEWHQDWAFYPHTNDDMLAVGVMLDDCTVENGAMLVLPDTHRGPVHDHHSDGYFCGAMDPEACGLDFSKAVSAVGRAGSMSFHHVRAVHGSAQNTSDKPRVLLLYEFAAADAWPLSGVPDLAAFDSRLVAGEPTITPRLADVPVRMPLPPAPRQGSIYENQTTAKSRYFADRKTAA
ncbi:phytanoyl-CoA hydroxylase [Inquilinus ginsengisoli]|uniref:phytanoyl-CoA dioxygenase family protein n=1 Tax=Inquilinus ginsengisoli TaxID=363840 RepID=UPI003D1993F2